MTTETTMIKETLIAKDIHGWELIEIITDDGTRTFTAYGRNHRYIMGWDNLEAAIAWFKEIGDEVSMEYVVLYQSDDHVCFDVTDRKGNVTLMLNDTFGADFTVTEHDNDSATYTGTVNGFEVEYWITRGCRKVDASYTVSHPEHNNLRADGWCTSITSVKRSVSKYVNSLTKIGTAMGQI